MQLQRFVGLIDLGVATVVLVTLVLPPREMYAGAAYKATDAEQLALALAEARTLAAPDDGAAIEELSRRLAKLEQKDWAIETAVSGSERAKGSPTRWRALLAASHALDERNDVVPALDYANRALSACEDHPAACPAFELVRMKQHQGQLAAGVATGIDPHRGPEAAKAFRRAGESALRQIHLGGHYGDRGATTAPTPASGSAGGSGGNIP
jgi:hypothetical protein